MAAKACDLLSPSIGESSYTHCRVQQVYACGNRNGENIFEQARLRSRVSVAAPLICAARTDASPGSDTLSPQLSLILYLLLPLWVIAGFADWLCHRMTAIERTSGARESLLHLVMLAQIGLPVLAALLFTPNALVFALLIGGFVLHQLTELWDVTYSEKSRRITPVEQQVHGIMEMAPFAIILLLASVHWGQFCALFGIGDESAQFALTRRVPAISPAYLVGLGCAIVLLDVLPYLEELLRCLRAKVDAAPALRERFSVSRAPF